MKTGFRQSMAVLHTWAGLLPGWLLFIIFLFGTVSFFKQEISTWMQPELRDEALSSVAVDKLWQQLASNAPGAKAWQISLPPQRGGETLRASWQAEEQRQTLQLHPSSGEALTTRDTHGGNFLFSFHYNLYYIPWQLARYLVCIASLLMLVALLSGVVIHRKIFIDFFTLRLGKGQRSWLDVHNITAVVALPFHLMITWTGLATLLLTIMPWAILANFPDPSEFRQAIRPTAPHVQPAGVMAEPMPLSKIIATAEQHFNGVRPAFIRVHHPGDLNAMVEIFPHTDRLGSPHQAIFFSGVNGQLLQSPATPGAAIRTLDVMTDLHSARFADPVLRWLYFFSGVGGTLMIATGLILWTVKRGRQMPASTSLNPATQHFSVDGNQRNRGIELTANGEPVEGIRVLGGAAWTDAELTKSDNSNNVGNTAPAVPDFQFNLSGEWDVSALSGLTLTARVLHTASQYVDAANTQKLPDWQRFDVGARYAFISNGTPVTIRGAIENVLNENYWQSAARAGLTVGTPITFLVSVSADF